MPVEPLILSFVDVSVAEGNRLAGTLAEALRDVDPSIVVDRRRERPDTQDFGATLAVMLGTTAAITSEADLADAARKIEAGKRVWAENGQSFDKMHNNGASVSLPMISVTETN